ncbi:hypothetical protein OIO90_004243 [Microbotryomycetes sp. JL221]|nr:hypothetical protein OIO90_004243 [Microbotryomycetes sp. JL221]
MSTSQDDTVDAPCIATSSSRVFPVSTLRRKSSATSESTGSFRTAAQSSTSRTSSAQESACQYRQSDDPLAEPQSPRLIQAEQLTWPSPLQQPSQPRRPSLDPIDAFGLQRSTTISDFESLPRIKSPLMPSNPLERQLWATNERLTKTKFPQTRPHLYKFVPTSDTQSDTVNGRNGHYVVTGMQGTLLHCEDEPIHAPGSIQSYGVLMVLEDRSDGKFIVHQVSDSSEAVIGINTTDILTANSISDLFAEQTLLDLADALEEFDHLCLRATDALPFPIQFTVDTPRGAAYAFLHRHDPIHQPRRFILELELVQDDVNPTSPRLSHDDGGKLKNALLYATKEALEASSLSLLQPLLRLKAWKTNAKDERVKRDLDTLSLMADINEQLAKADELDPLLTFDEEWNGVVAAEQVDPNVCADLYRGLIWPASDIPPQARDLYKINKVRVLYDRDANVSRMCCRTQQEAETQLDMTHCLLRSMSPIHVKYLGNMSVKSSMSVSIMLGNQLWGLVCLHELGGQPRRPSPPLRRLCKMVGDSVSTNLERILLRQKLSARRLVSSTLHQETHLMTQPADLLSLFEADFGALIVRNQTKILGNVEDSQELLVLVDYFRELDFEDIVHTRQINRDFQNIVYVPRFKIVAGFLAIPLTSKGQDFVVFVRRGIEEEVSWAGNPCVGKPEGESKLEPRHSFKLYKEIVRGKSRPWTDAQLEQAAMLSTVFAFWKGKESAESSSRLTSLLLANASHEARTPLNAIINHLELALEAEIASPELRESLVRSAIASRSLLVAINDMLDLSKAGAGPISELYVNEPIDLRALLQDVLAVFRLETTRKHLSLDFIESSAARLPDKILGDALHLRKVVTNVVSNAVKFTDSGSITVRIGLEDKMTLPDGEEPQSRYYISVQDTGCGIAPRQLEILFRQLEEVDPDDEAQGQPSPLGLGFAVVARTVRILGGQLRLHSILNEGTTVTILLPFVEPTPSVARTTVNFEPSDAQQASSQHESLKQPFAASAPSQSRRTAGRAATIPSPLTNLEPPLPSPLSVYSSTAGETPSPPRLKPSRSVSGADAALLTSRDVVPPGLNRSRSSPSPPRLASTRQQAMDPVASTMRVLIVEDDPISRRILSKRLERDGHEVVMAQHGLEALAVLEDIDVDVVLMDVSMPVMDGLEATRQIRQREQILSYTDRPSVRVNGRLPVIAVSAHVEPHWKDVLTASGFDGHCDKPVDVSRLRLILAGVLNTDMRNTNIHETGKWRAGGWFWCAAGTSA